MELIVVMSMLVLSVAVAAVAVRLALQTLFVIMRSAASPALAVHFAPLIEHPHAKQIAITTPAA